MNRKSLYSKIVMVLTCTTLFYGCGSKINAGDTTKTQVDSEINNSINGGKTVKSFISEVVSYDSNDSYIDWKNENPSYIELSANTANLKGSGAVVESGKISITSSGTYVISGKLDKGQIIVDVKDKGTVRLVLKGMEIKNSDNAPIYVKNAGKTIISLEAGTENTIIDGAKYTLEDTSSDEPTAAIFSKDNLVINGTGKLTVKANYKDGITSKDDLKITGGNILITSVDDGIVGRDILAIKESNITIEAGGDAMKSTNDTESTKGIIAIENGTFNLKSERDGMQAETAVLLGDGSFNITSGGGSVNGIKKTEQNMKGFGGQRGFKDVNNPNTTTNANNANSTEANSTTETETESKKAIKSTAYIGIAGGIFNIDSSDDSIHSNKNVVIEGGNLTITSGDDGMHADEALEIKGGKINITKSYEGIEASKITVLGGEIHVTASDDGINAAGGADGSSVNGRAGANKFKSSGDNKITINGGYIVINAVSDGLDANGSINMTNGTVVISAANGGMGNGAIDYDATFEMTGGFLVGSGGAIAPSDSSTQCSIQMTFPQMKASGTLVSLQDSNGKSITTFAPTREYQSVVISSPELKKGESYTLYSGGTSTGIVTDGIYKDGKYENGTKIVSFTISNSVTWLNESGVITAPQGEGSGPGGTGGPKGQRPPRVEGETPWDPQGKIPDVK